MMTRFGNLDCRSLDYRTMAALLPHCHVGMAVRWAFRPIPAQFGSTEMAAFGRIWTHLAAFGRTWSHLAAFGRIWAHLATIGPICPPLTEPPASAADRGDDGIRKSSAADADGSRGIAA